MTQKIINGHIYDFDADFKQYGYLTKFPLLIDDMLAALAVGSAGIAEASSQNEENAKFAAGYKIVIRLDILGIATTSTTTTTTSTTAAPTTTTTTLAIPAAPTGHSVAAGNTLNTLYHGSSAGATSYNAYWTSNGSTPSKSNGTKITGLATPYSHTSLTNGTLYKYVFTAVNAAGESTESTVVSATPSTATTTTTTAAPTTTTTTTTTAAPTTTTTTTAAPTTTTTTTTAAPTTTTTTAGGGSQLFYEDFSSNTAGQFTQVGSGFSFANGQAVGGVDMVDFLKVAVAMGYSGNILRITVHATIVQDTQGVRIGVSNSSSSINTNGYSLLEYRDSEYGDGLELIKNGSSLQSTPGGMGGGVEVTLRMDISSSGVSIYENGALVLSNSDHTITSFTYLWLSAGTGTKINDVKVENI